MTLDGIDSIWRVDEDTYHFIEAKSSISGGAVYGVGQKKMSPTAKYPIPKAPAGLGKRRHALWCLLTEPLKGTQMGKPWTRASIDNRGIGKLKNLSNRWLYLILALPTTGNPFGSIADPNGKSLHLLPAAGVDDHYQAAAELLASRDFLNILIHDKHKETHGISEIFDAAEIDFVVEARKEVKRAAKENAENDVKDKPDKGKLSGDSANTPNKPDSSKGKTKKGKGKG